jgi:histidinol-phosphatase (PHP family)
MIDNHIHTKLCKHAEGELFEYIEKAILRGITEISFTDHIPLPNDFDLAHRMQPDEMKTYAHWVKQAKETYPEITIRYGIEADYYEGLENYTENFLARHDFDLVIMSVHFIRHWPEGNWVFDYNFPDRSQSEIYKDYLSTLIKGIKTGLFDVLGHADMIKSVGDSLIQIVPNEVNNLLETLQNSDMSIEINTSGYRKKVSEPYPGLDWLPLIKKKSISVTMGSDAHHPDQVGLEFENVYQKIKENGINKLIVYNKRLKKKVDI